MAEVSVELASLRNRTLLQFVIWCNMLVRLIIAAVLIAIVVLLFLPAVEPRRSSTVDWLMWPIIALIVAVVFRRYIFKWFIDK